MMTNVPSPQQLFGHLDRAGGTERRIFDDVVHRHAQAGAVAEIGLDLVGEIVQRRDDLGDAVRRSRSTMWCITGLLAIGASGFGRREVSGRRREPSPPAITTAFILYLLVAVVPHAKRAQSQ